MPQSRLRRRVGILLALLVPALILLYGLGSAEAQFPRPPGMPGMPKPPQPPLGPKMPGGPFGPNKPFGPNIVFDWRCSKCGAIVATTNSPLRPGIANCPSCGVRFLNGGGGSFLRPPPNLPPDSPPPGNMPPGNGPPGNLPPPPPMQPPPVQPQPPPAPPPPADVPANPVVAPPADPAPPLDAAPAAGTCQWCNRIVSPGSRVCGRCMLIAVGAVVGVTLILAIVTAVATLTAFLCLRKGAR
jgi:hypothetical protein